jgi:hypothetical protein
MGKVLIIVGIVLIIAGVLIQYVGKIPLFGKLPGDIAYEGKNFKFYFPIVTCIIISIILSLIMYFVRKN